MRKVFYDPERDNLVVGMTDGDEPFDFPFIEADTEWHSADNLVVKDGKLYQKDSNLASRLSEIGVLDI